jgi:hypothetical protein
MWPESQDVWTSGNSAHNITCFDPLRYGALQGEGADFGTFDVTWKMWVGKIE